MIFDNPWHAFAVRRRAEPRPPLTGSDLRGAGMASQPPRRRRLEVEDIGDIAVVNFVDKKILDEQNIQMIGDDLFRLVDELGRRKILLNFQNVELMSSAALGKLIALHRNCKASKASSSSARSPRTSSTSSRSPSSTRSSPSWRTSRRGFSRSDASPVPAASFHVRPSRQR